MGFVYLLGDFDKEGFYKIGVTRGKIENRIKKLQTGNSGEIYMVDYYETLFPFFIERFMHNKFFSKNKSGEWFELTSEDAKKFKENCKKFEDIAKELYDNPFLKNKLK